MTLSRVIVSPITISETSTSIRSGISVGSASTVTSRVTCSSTPPSLDAGRLVGALELDRDLGLDRLVEADLEAVEVDDLAAKRVALLLLDDDRHGVAAVDLEVEERLALGSRLRRSRSGTWKGFASPPWP